jgi:hypothetical protein
MKTTSLAKIGRQITLPIHVYPAIIAVAPKIRAAAVTVLARLLLEAAVASDRSEGVRDEP